MASTNRAKPSFTDQIPMLKGVRPLADETSFADYGGSRPATRSRMRQYIVGGSYNDVQQRIFKELPGKPSWSASGPSEKQYEFKDAREKKLIRIIRHTESETMVDVFEDTQATWADRINAWWGKTTGQKC